MFGLAGIRLEEVDGLLARPAQRVHTGIHHQADGPPHFIGQCTEFGVGVGVKAHLLAQAFGIKPPAFDERGVPPAIAAVPGQIAQLLLNGDLQVMARHRLMQRQRFHLPLGAGVQCVGIGEEIARPAGFQRTGLVVGRSLGFFGIGRHRHHTVGRAGQMPEQFDQLGVGALGDVAVGA